MKKKRLPNAVARLLEVPASLTEVCLNFCTLNYTGLQILHHDVQLFVVKVRSTWKTSVFKFLASHHDNICFLPDEDVFTV